MVPDGRGEDKGTLLMVRIYLAIVGIVLISLAVLEIAQPLRTLEFWKGWINHRLFPLHGVGLVILGFPFTCYNGSSAGKIIFILGVLIVLTGPIIILYADKEFGRFFDYLDSSGLLDNTWVVLTSDHGEMFERGIDGHDTEVLYEPVIRIPLMIFEPGRKW